ncbi:Rrf2 family transcriptional regulator [Geothrix oryzae]|uniref:Rrf2 family transcriptional regulator n=1 Tax=Geothrix oryzae TaxID=2927975 RepID=A0ABN6UUB4_9BACT|nr:Rrf2 family transcriptional regulator [Geothrix sp.]BDU68213.1 Rrf2 family transcriptional regulator [Geothrix oryzae]
MLPLSQTTGYALRAMRCLQEPGGQPVLVESVADYTGIPRSYLSKLVHKLAKKGLVTARRGHHGGVVLAKPATEITLEDLSEAIDGVTWRNRCLVGLAGCSDETPCVLHEFWGETLDMILARLRGVTLADMARHQDPGVERFRADHGLN